MCRHQWRRWASCYWTKWQTTRSLHPSFYLSWGESAASLTQETAQTRVSAFKRLNFDLLWHWAVQSRLPNVDVRQANGGSFKSCGSHVAAGCLLQQHISSLRVCISLHIVHTLNPSVLPSWKWEHSVLPGLCRVSYSVCMPGMCVWVCI